MNKNLDYYENLFNFAIQKADLTIHKKTSWKGRKKCLKKKKWKG